MFVILNVIAYAEMCVRLMEWPSTTQGFFSVQKVIGVLFMLLEHKMILESFNEFSLMGVDVSLINSSKSSKGY